MENNPHEKTWVEIQEHGVLQTIESWEDYVLNYEVGFANADHFLSQQTNLWSQETLTRAHKLLFKDIAPWAGQYSNRQEIIASIPGSPPDLRDEEFQLLEKQMELLDMTATSDLARTRMVAFHHARILCMHPFRDGNGRVTRLLLSHQMQRIAGKVAPLHTGKAEYIDALQSAHPKGNLAPLSNLLCQTYLGHPDPAKFLPAPFRMSSRQLSDNPNTRLEESLREGPKIINTQETPEKIRWLARMSWFDVEQLIAAKATDNEGTVKTLWKENQHRAMTATELKQFLQQMEDLQPYVQRLGFFNTAGTSWQPVYNALTKVYREATQQSRPENPGQKNPEIS